MGIAAATDDEDGCCFLESLTTRKRGESSRNNLNPNPTDDNMMINLSDKHH
jgi:hypothetical protein